MWWISGANLVCRASLLGGVKDKYSLCGANVKILYVVGSNLEIFDVVGGQCGGVQYRDSLCAGGQCEDSSCGANALCNAILPFWSKWFSVVVGANVVGSNIEILYVVGACVKILFCHFKVWIPLKFLGVCWDVMNYLFKG